MKALLMKFTVVVSCLFALSIACPLTSVAGFDLAAASAVWFFDDGGGDVAADMTANGNDGDLRDGPTWVDGKFGGALEFAGGHVAVDEPVGLPVVWDARTVVLWFKWAEVQWSVELLGWGPHLGGKRFGIWMDAAKAVGVEIPAAPVWLFAWDGDTDWHHLAVALPEGERMKSTDLKLYFDGEPVQGDDFGRPVTILNTSPGPLTIGVIPVLLSSAFHGILDEVAIFPWELSPQNIADIAASGLQVAQAVSPSGKLATSWGALKTR